jgi:hypothetical protein
MQVVSHDVIELLSQTRVIFQDPSETTPTVQPKFWANVQVPSPQFRHVIAGIKQVLAESPQRPLTGIFGSAQREEPQYPSKILQHLLSDISVDTGHYQLVVDTDGPRSVLQGGR